jgi:hypothetical protein
MAASEAEIVVILVLEQMQLKFQRLYTQVFEVAHLDGLDANTRRYRPTAETHDGGRQTGSSCISCYNAFS